MAEGFIVKRFGSGNRTYLFPIYQKAYMPNFGEGVPRITRMPGAHGGYDEDGRGEMVSDIGDVRLDFTLYSPTRAGMDAQIDAVMAMRSWGQRALYIQPSDPESPERFCYAKARISISRAPSGNTDLVQPVSINFSVPDPFWFTQGTESATWGSGVEWGSGIAWGGGAAPVAVSGLVSNFTEEDVKGNANTLPRIIFQCGASQTAENIIIRRLISGTVADEVRYNDVLGNNDTLEIDCRGQKVLLNNVDAYSNAFEFLRSEWFQLEPGDNEIQVLMQNSGDAGTITLKYFEVYR